MISIVTTVFNGEPFINDAFRTISEQTLKKFNWIIVDDGSLDNSVNCIISLMKQYSNLDIILIQPGKVGRGKALNIGITKATYKWIAVFDIDDLWHPQKLEIQHNILQNYKCDILCTQSKMFVKEDEIKTTLKEKLTLKNLTINNIGLNKILYSSHIPHCSVVMRKDIVSYDENRKSQFDLELWFRLLSDKAKCLKIEYPLTLHKIHDKQNFEGQSKNYLYGLRSIKLRLYYSITTFNIFALIYNFLKIAYVFLNRTWRLNLVKLKSKKK